MLVALGKNDGQGEGKGMAGKGRRMLNTGRGGADWGVGGDTNSKHWFTTSFLQPLPYLVTP